jgi:hypothetical protein
MRKGLLALVVLAACLAGATAALAGGDYGYGDSTTATTSTQSTAGTTQKADSTYAFKATLNSGQEVPHPNAPAGAAGTFVAKSVEKSSGTTLTWTLKFHGLSGKAMAAHLHMGAKGKAGPVLVPLCGPCKTTETGTVTIKSSVESALEKGTTYVNVHTAKNAGGEIRGQVRMTSKS